MDENICHQMPALTQLIGSMNRKNKANHDASQTSKQYSAVQHPKDTGEQHGNSE